MSKRKLQWFVDTGRVTDWTDPRFPTVQGMMRRGLTVQALRDFILQQGASKNVTNQEWDKLWTMNKKIIDPVCGRHTAVIAKKRIPVTLVNGPSQPEVEIVLRHKKNPASGKKAMTKTNRILIDHEDAKALSLGEEVTLMNWGNCFVEEINKDEATGEITGIVGKLNPTGDFKKTKLKLTWLADIEDNVSLNLVYYDHLINKKKIEEGDKIEDLVTKDSKKEVDAIGDANMRTLQLREIIPRLRIWSQRILRRRSMPLVMPTCAPCSFGRSSNWRGRGTSLSMRLVARPSRSTTFPMEERLES